MSDDGGSEGRKLTSFEKFMNFYMGIVDKPVSIMKGKQKFTPTFMR